jgi:hypothetical protein
MPLPDTGILKDRKTSIEIVSLSDLKLSSVKAGAHTHMSIESLGDTISIQIFLSFPITTAGNSRKFFNVLSLV